MKTVYPYEKVVVLNENSVEGKPCMNRKSKDDELLHINPEMRRFAYSGISQEKCEGKFCFYPLGESRIGTSGLISVGFCILLEWITWWIYPMWWVPYPLEGLGVSELDSTSWTAIGSSVMPLGAYWVSEPGGRSWGPGSSESSFQNYLGRGMLEYHLRCQSFTRVKFYCLASSECSSTRFFQLPGTVTFLMCSTVDTVPSNTT